MVLCCGKNSQRVKIFEDLREGKKLLVVFVISLKIFGLFIALISGVVVLYLRLPLLLYFIIMIFSVKHLSLIGDSLVKVHFSVVNLVIKNYFYRTAVPMDITEIF